MMENGEFDIPPMDFDYYDGVWCEYHLKNGRTVVRQVNITNKPSYDTVLDFVMAQDIIYQLPPLDDEITTMTQAGELWGNFYEFGDSYKYKEISDNLYKMYYNEVGGYQYDNTETSLEFTQSLHSFYRPYSEYSFGDIRVGGDIDNVAFMNYFPLTKSTPKTTTSYLHEVNSQFGPAVKEDINMILAGSEDIIEFSIDGMIVSNTTPYTNEYLYYRETSYDENAEDMPGMMKTVYFSELCQLILDTDLMSMNPDTAYIQ